MCAQAQKKKEKKKTTVDIIDKSKNSKTGKNKGLKIRATDLSPKTTELMAESPTQYHL